MIGQVAAAALLLLPLHTTEGATLALPTATKKIVQGSNRIGRLLRDSENAAVGVNRNILRGTSGLGHLALLDKCYMTDDCAPGLFMVSSNTY